MRSIIYWFLRCVWEILYAAQLISDMTASNNNYFQIIYVPMYVHSYGVDVKIILIESYIMPLTLQT